MIYKIWKSYDKQVTCFGKIWKSYEKQVTGIGFFIFIFGKLNFTP
jgi:hypothetical protein